MIDIDLVCVSMLPSAPSMPTSFDEAKANAKADPLLNKQRRVENLMALEQTATQAAQQGASPLELGDLIQKGSAAIASVFPDIPEYEKAVSAAGRFKNLRAADNPQDTLDGMPQFG